MYSDWFLRNFYVFWLVPANYHAQICFFDNSEKNKWNIVLMRSRGIFRLMESSHQIDNIGEKNEFQPKFQIYISLPALFLFIYFFIEKDGNSLSAQCLSPCIKVRKQNLELCMCFVSTHNTRSRDRLKPRIYKTTWLIFDVSVIKFGHLD